MKKRLEEKWDEAAATGERVEVGRVVVCDVCNDDYTDSTECGGFIFGSYGYCPTCAEKHLPAIKGYGEEHYIRARCRDGEPFADFIRRERGPNAYIQIHGAAKKQSPVEPVCIRCKKRPGQIEEYIEAAADEEMTPDEYVRQEEGTYNRENGHFLCTPCYVKAGMPSSPQGWVAP